MVEDCRSEEPQDRRVSVPLKPHLKAKSKPAEDPTASTGDRNPKLAKAELSSLEAETARTITDLDKEEIAFLSSCYFECCCMIRHHETMRATSTNLIFLLDGALVALIKLGTTPDYRLIGSLLAALGFFGATISLKHTERSVYFGSLARRTIQAIEGTIAGPATERLRASRHVMHQRIPERYRPGGEYPRAISAAVRVVLQTLSWFPLGAIWASMHVLIGLFGVLLYFRIVRF